MVIKGIIEPENKFRIFFDIDKDNGIKVKHFVVKTTTFENPFIPHKHEQEELWYMIEGKAEYSEDGVDYSVEAGDLMQIRPWVLHGLRTETKAVWICLG